MLRIITILSIGLLSACFNATAFAAAHPQTPPVIADREVRIVYPRFDNLGEAGAAMTRTIAAEINLFAEIFRQPEYSGQVGYTVEYDRFPLVSVTVDEMYYRYRAAHPMSYLRAFTFDTRTGRTLRLADLFRDGADYRSRLNEIMAARLAEENIRLLEGKQFAGIGDEQEFYLTPVALVVYYQRYEYTPYVAGFFKFAIPYQAIANLLRPEGLPVLCLNPADAAIHEGFCQ